MTGVRGARGAGSGGSPAAQPANGDAGQGDAVVRRTREGWRVGSADVPDLTSAMVLADLLAAELSASEPAKASARQAFEQLRAAARSRGRRVIDIATDVVASATNPLLQLPDELSRPRPGGRHARQARGVLGSE